MHPDDEYWYRRGYDDYLYGETPLFTPSEDAEQGRAARPYLDGWYDAKHAWCTVTTQPKDTAVEALNALGNRHPDAVMRDAEGCLWQPYGFWRSCDQSVLKAADLLARGPLVQLRPQEK